MKAGDKIRCINAGTNSNITAGNEYVVAETYEGSSELMVRIVGDKGANVEGYYASRFEVTETAEAIADSAGVKITFGGFLTLSVDLSKPLGLKIATAALEAYAAGVQ